jgi:uncharacterized protein DUF6084
MTTPVEAPAEVAPEFEVLGATVRRHAAAPAIDFDVHVSESSGRQVYAIALTAQVMLEPARRRYDAETHARLEELFGRAEGWATPNNVLWHQAYALVPSFTGATTFHVAVPVSLDMEVSSAKYLNGLEDGEVPLAFNFNGTIHYRESDGRLQLSLVPWRCSASFRMPVATWREAVDHYFPHARWIGLHAQTLAALELKKRALGLPTLDATVARLLEERP